MTEIYESVKAFGTGFATTFKHLFRKPITEEYPEYKRPLPERSRARIILTCDPDGKKRCVACYLCSAVCPASCISMQSAEQADGRRRYTGTGKNETISQATWCSLKTENFQTQQCSSYL